MHNKQTDPATAFFHALWQNAPEGVEFSDEDVGMAAADYIVRSITPIVLRRSAKDHPALAELNEAAAKIEALAEVTSASLKATQAALQEAQRVAAIVLFDSEDYVRWREKYPPPSADNDALLDTAERAERSARRAYDMLAEARSAVRNAAYTLWSPYPSHHALCAVGQITSAYAKSGAVSTSLPREERESVANELYRRAVDAVARLAAKARNQDEPDQVVVVEDTP